MNKTVVIGGESMIMNYENLYVELTAASKQLDNSIKTAARASKLISKDKESGDLKDIDKAVRAMEDALNAQKEALDSLQNSLESFDRSEYVAGGEFEKQLVKECRNAGIDVRKSGDMVYEMFPNRVVINADTQDVMIDKKRVSSLRPKAVAETIHMAQDRMQKASFNAERFLGELLNAYDLLILKKKKKTPDAELNLTDIYKIMVPMGRLKKEYDVQSFAFDIARLYRSGITETKDGRVLDMGPSRDNKNAIRVLDENGKEQFFALISFVKR